MINTGINTERIGTRNLETEKVNFVNPFTQHPAEVGMSYPEHARFALMLARKTFLMALASLIHAFFPFLFVTYTSRKINQINKLLQNRNSNNEK